MKVLYIDDEADTEKMASKFEIMKENGIDVASVVKVEDVLPMLKKLSSEIGLIVLDIIMPPGDFYKMDETNGGTTTGLRLLKDIRKEYKNILIIIISIKRPKNTEEILNKYNVSKWLDKPISTYLVAKTIKSLMK